MQITAVATAPDHFRVPRKDPVGAQVAGQFAVAFFMLFFRHHDGFPGIGRPFEALINGHLGKPRVKLGVFKPLAVRGRDQIIIGVFDDPGWKAARDLQLPAVEKLEKAQGVFTLLVGGLFKDVADLHKPLVPGTPGEI